MVEFITSVHLFHMFPDLEEGGLATYRAALVQNQHLAILAEVLGKLLYELKSVLKTKSSKYSGLTWPLFHYEWSKIDTLSNLAFGKSQKILSKMPK